MGELQVELSSQQMPSDVRQAEQQQRFLADAKTELALLQSRFIYIIISSQTFLIII